MKVAVIGLGSMGKRRIRLLKRFEEITDIIGIDSREDRLEEIEQTLKCRSFTSLEEAMKYNPDLQAVFVCTSPLSHCKIIEESLQNNLHVFTEINLVQDGYLENIASAKENNVVLFLSSTFLYRDEIGYIQHYLKGENNLNYIYHVGQYLPDWHPWENISDFFIGNKRTNGCREILAIELPWILRTFGNINQINVITDKMSDLNISYNDNYMIQIQHDNGNKGILIVDVVSPKAVRNLEIYGENVYCSWNGTPDSLEMFDKKTREMTKPEFSFTPEHLKGYQSSIIEDAYQNEIKNFLEVINDDCKPLYSFEEDLKVLEIIDRIENHE